MGSQLSAASKRKGHLESSHGITEGGTNFSTAVRLVEQRRTERNTFERKQQHPNAAAAPQTKKFLQLTWEQLLAKNAASASAEHQSSRQAEQRLLRAIASRGEAFCCVEDPFFREMMADGRAEFKMVIPSGNRVAEKMREFAEQSRTELFFFMSKLSAAKGKPLVVSLLSDSATICRSDDMSQS